MNLKVFLNKFKWEFWPMWLANIPVGFIWLFFSVRAKNLFFFSTVNPNFENGAMMGASKFNILKSLPKRYLPETIYIKNSSNAYNVAIREMRDNHLEFPVILKPDIGERGLLVELIKNKHELKAYLETNIIDYLLQEFVAYPNEAGIFYHRLPNQSVGMISSIAIKNNLSIIGNGFSSMVELLSKNIHGLVQLKRLEETFGESLKRIPKKGEKILIEPIGNHSRGTKIRDGNHLISKQLITLFDKINQGSSGVYYGRYDIKYNSWEELLEGENFKIIELNGTASEPMHIYDSSIPVYAKYKSFYGVWKTIFQISKVQRNKGVEPMPFKEALGYLSNYFKYIRSIDRQWRSNI